MKRVFWWLVVLFGLTSCQNPSCNSYIAPIIVSDEAKVAVIDGLQYNLKCKEI